MASSVKTFNDMLEQFLNELEQTFPEEKSFKKYHTSFDIMRKANPKKCVEVLMNVMTPVSAQIMSKDDTVFQSSDFSDLEIGKYWNDELSENTKNVIWQYLQTLNILGMTITNIPPEMLSMVENVASKCVDQMGSGEGGGLDMGNMMSSLSSLMGGMMGGGGGMGMLGGKK